MSVTDVTIRDLPDDTMLVFVSDTHIGGSSGSDIFDSAAELGSLFDELAQEEGGVELVLIGDFLDLLRMDESEGDRVAVTLARPEYEDLFASLRRFGQAPRHRVVYVAGNHDAEVWWNKDIQQTLQDAELVDEFALSYAARFASLPEELVYCEHGNQFDPANSVTDYTDRLDVPVGSYIVTEVVRPLGGGAAVTKRLDLRDVSFVFPLADVPQWIAGRVFYQCLRLAILFLLLPLVLASLTYEVITAVLGSSAGTLRTIIREVSYDVALIVLAFGVFFLVSRRIAKQAISSLATRLRGPTASEGELHGAAIREFLDEEESPPMAGNITSGDMAVFISGHTHAPGLSEVARPNGRTTLVANTGCWLRQLQPVRAWLDAPTVFVPVYVNTHLRIRPSDGRLTVELWDRPRPAERRLLLIERLAILGRASPEAGTHSEPRLIAQRAIG